MSEQEDEVLAKLEKEILPEEVEKEILEEEMGLAAEEQPASEEPVAEAKSRPEEKKKSPKVTSNFNMSKEVQATLLEDHHQQLLNQQHL